MCLEEWSTSVDVQTLHVVFTFPYSQFEPFNLLINPYTSRTVFK
jgi:hypothetical protein